jgi:transcriptional regulator GlxA family with amidase domain
MALHNVSAGLAIRECWLFEVAACLQVEAASLECPYVRAYRLPAVLRRLPPASGAVEELVLDGLRYRALRHGCHFLRRSPQPDESIDAQTAEACRIISTTFETELSLSLVAAKVGLTPRVLSHRFKNALRVSFHDYLRAVRIEGARRILATSSSKTEAVAAAVGYSSRTAFHRDFLQAVHMTPAQFRRRVSARS